MSLVFQNIDPPPPLPARRGCPPPPPPPTKAGGTHSPGGVRGGGSIFWKTRDIGLPSYRNNLSTERTKKEEREMGKGVGEKRVTRRRLGMEARACGRRGDRRRGRLRGDRMESIGMEKSA